MLCEVASVNVNGERSYVADVVLGCETPLTSDKTKAFLFNLGAASYYASTARFPSGACALKIETSDTAYFDPAYLLAKKILAEGNPLKRKPSIRQRLISLFN